MKRTMQILAVHLLVFLGACSDKEQSVMDSPEAKNIVASQSAYVVPSAPAVTVEQGCMDESLRVSLCFPILENTIAKKYPELLQRNGKTLKINLINGENIEVTNTDKREFAFVKYLPEIQYGLLTVQSEREVTFDLVNLRTGATTRVGGNTLLSPDSHRLAILPISNGEKSTPNAIAVYWVTPNNVLQEYKFESSKVVVTELKWIDNKTISLSTLSSEDSYPRVYKDVLHFTGPNIADSGKWRIDGTIEMLLEYGRLIAAKSCESPIFSKEEDTNKYDATILDVITTRACPTHKVFSRSFNNNKPPITRIEEVDLLDNKLQPPLGLLIGTPRAKIIDILGNPDAVNSEINKMVYFGPDEGGCSSSVNFILDKGMLKEITWGFCNE